MKCSLIGTAAAAFALTTGGTSAQAADALANRTLAQEMPSPTSGKSDVPRHRSIAGLWHTVNRLPDGTFFLEAYTMWRSDGTFEELANRPPATGSISTGVWTQDGNTVTLPLAVAWLYDTNNNFAGTLKLTETYVVKNHGDTLAGTFDAKFYDTQGNLMQEVSGSSIADRLAG
jgi:hypothetical protein